MYLGFLIGSVFLALIAAGISGAACSESRSSGRTQFRANLTITVFVVTAIFGIIALCTPENALYVLWFCFVLTGAIVVPGLAYESTFQDLAAKQYDYCEDACSWALANFNLLALDATSYFTAADIERALRNPNTTDADRKMLGFFQVYLSEVGHEVEVYRTYRVYVENGITEVAQVTNLFGISKDDLQAYPKRLLEKPSVGGWLQRATNTGVTPGSTTPS